MKRKRSLTSTQNHRNTPSTTRSVQTSLKGCPLLQLPREIRVLILQRLLYSPEPLGRKSVDNHEDISERRLMNAFTLYPAIMRVCRQVYDEGYEVLYCQNTAKATITLYHNDECSSVILLDGIYLHSPGVIIQHRFIKWDVTVSLHIEIPREAPVTIFRFVSEILREIPNLKDLKVRLELWDDVDDPDSHITFADPQDCADIAEQIFRPFSAIRVEQVEFIDKHGYLIHTTLPLSRLIMSDIPPPTTLHNLFNNLGLFLDDSLSEQSRRVVKARLAPLAVACDQYDVDGFRSALRPLLHYLSHFRGLKLPQHLAEELTHTAIEMGNIPDC